MKVILGVDVGGSTTKIVGFHGRQLIGTLQVKAADQITSMYGAMGNFLHRYGIQLEEVSAIVLTGVGASYFHEDIYGIKTHQIDEFQAIGYGGLYLSGLKEALVASMGTGTALVRAVPDGNQHIGGSGIGGGTLLGLSSKLVNKSDIDAILQLAETGDLNHVDLSVQEISQREIPSLPPNITASNFGRVRSTATDADFALGLINMVFQTIGLLAVFALRNDSIRDVVLTGTLTTFPQAKEVFPILSRLHDVNFVIPQQAVFATAIGAAIPFLREDEPH